MELSFQAEKPVSVRGWDNVLRFRVEYSNSVFKLELNALSQSRTFY